MLATIVVLYSLAVVSSAGSGIDIPIPMDAAAVDAVPLNLHINFPPIGNVSEQARKDFVDILLNQSLTKDQMEAGIKAWAAKNGVLDAVNAEQTKDDQRTREFRVNATLAFGELPAAFQQLNAIEDNKSLTAGQSADQKIALFDSLKNPYARRLLDAVSYPEYPEGEELPFSVNVATNNKRR